MILQRTVGAMAVAVAMCGVARAAEPAPNPHQEHMMQCAKACSDCQRECDMCAKHCINQVAAGKKDHVTTVHTCLDCADVCAAAARIVSRHGPMSPTICTACANACDMCAKACDKFPDDAHMKKCAEECRKCATACREMLKHVA